MLWEWRRFLASGLLFLIAAVTHAAPPPAADINTNIEMTATNCLGDWVWDKVTFDQQTCRFWRAFDIDTPVVRATLRMTVDNGYRLYLDGREIGRGSDWRNVTIYDIKRLLHPGHHVLAVEAFNDRLQGGMILGLDMQMADGGVAQIVSDPQWRVVPLSVKNWEDRRYPSPEWGRVVVVGKAWQEPWSEWPRGVAVGPPLMPVVLAFWQTLWFQAVVLSLFMLALLVCGWLLAQLAVQSRAQRLLQLQRARIARDIHDDLGARLSQLVLMGELAQNELPEESATRGQINQICERARELGYAMDEIVWAVSSRRDTLRDFAAYVCKYAQLYLKTTSVRCRLDVELDLPPLPFDLAIRRNLLLAVKEAISNAAKHSGASELFLRIHRQGDGLWVMVEDNGCGFQVPLADPTRNGLYNMAQRMEEVGGRFVVDSAPGSGCRITFMLPLTSVRQGPRWLRKLFLGADKVSELDNLPAAVNRESEMNNPARHEN